MGRGPKELHKPSEIPAAQAPNVKAAAKCTWKVPRGCRRNILNPSDRWRTIRWSFVTQSPTGAVARSSSARKVVESDGFHQFGEVRGYEAGLRRDGS